MTLCNQKSKTNATPTSTNSPPKSKPPKKRLKEVNAEIEEKTEIRDNKVAERTDLEQFKALLEDRIAELLVKKGIREEQWNHQKTEHDKATAVIQ